MADARSLPVAPGAVHGQPCADGARAAAILENERVLIRDTLSTISAIARSVRGQRSAASLARLRELLEFVQVFDESCHRPKCDAMASALAGRSVPAVRTQEALQRRRAADARLLLSTQGRLAAAERDEPGAATELVGLLEQVRSRAEMRLAFEVEVLLEQAMRLLGSAEWGDLAEAFRAVDDPVAIHVERAGTRIERGRCVMRQAPSC